MDVAERDQRDRQEQHGDRPSARGPGTMQEQDTGLRRAMLSCRDGARLILEGPLIGSAGALEVMERLTGALTRSGYAAERVRVGADTLMSYVTGIVVQEQLGSAVTEPADWPADLAVRFPLVFGAGRGLTAMPAEELFHASIGLILGGLAVAT